MGSLLSRSSSSRAEKNKRKMSKRKRDRLQNTDVTMEINEYPIENPNESHQHSVNGFNGYEEWNPRNLQTSNVDPPGAPSTFPSKYPSNQSNLLSQKWPSQPHDLNNSYYQNNHLNMLNLPAMPFDRNQMKPSSMNNVFINPATHPALDERTSKKVQFAPQLQQPSQVLTPKVRLGSTQSWHETSVSIREPSMTSQSRPESAVNTQSTQRSAPSSLPTSAPVPKPIYVGIDHRATIAEREQNNSSSKRTRQSGEKTNSEHANQRTRSHGHHQHKHSEQNDSSVSKTSFSHSNKPNESSQTKPSHVQRASPILSTRSNVLAQKNSTHFEPNYPMDNDSRLNKTRSLRPTPLSHSEHQSLVHNEVPLSKNRNSQMQQKQHQPARPPNLRTNSPLRADQSAMVRRFDGRTVGTPVMRIPLAQHASHRPRAVLTSSPAGNVTRTRI